MDHHNYPLPYITLHPIIECVTAVFIVITGVFGGKRIKSAKQGGQLAKHNRSMCWDTSDPSESLWVSLDFQTRRVPPFSFSLVKLWLLFTWAKSTPTQAVAIPLLTSHLNYTTPFIFFSYHTSPHSLATFFFISHICLTPLPITNYAFIPSLILWLSFFFCPLQKSIQTARGLTLAFLSTATSDFTVCWHQCKDFFLFFFCVFL